MMPEQISPEELERQTAEKDYVPVEALKPGGKGDQVERLHRYLELFGYLESPILERFGFGLERAAAKTPERRDTFDNHTAKALRRLQEQSGLKPTGELDDPTLALMRKPRCGFPDVAESTDVAEFVLDSRWDH